MPAVPALGACPRPYGRTRTAAKPASPPRPIRPVTMTTQTAALRIINNDGAVCGAGRLLAGRRGTRCGAVHFARRHAKDAARPGLSIPSAPPHRCRWPPQSLEEECGLGLQEATMFR